MAAQVQRNDFQIFIQKSQCGNYISLPNDLIKIINFSFEQQVPILKTYLLIKILKASYNYLLQANWCS